MKKSLFLSALLLGTLSLAACHDHDEVCSDSTGGASSDFETETAAEEAIHNILYLTTEVDTLPANWQTAQYEPTYGIGTADSRVRYVVSTSRQDAIEFYKKLTEQDDNYTTTWTNPEVGTITLNSDSTASVYGSIKVNVKQLNTDEFRFVPATALGTNAQTNWTPYYHFGDVIKVTYQKDKSRPAEYWICLRSEMAGNSDTENAHWACFTLAKENVEHISAAGYNFKAPKDLNGDKTYLRTLPQLLQILAGPDEAYKSWKNWYNTNNTNGKDKRYGGYCFLGKPFPANYFSENAFTEILIAWNLFYAKGYLSDIIPAVENNYSLVEQCAKNKPLTFLCHGRSYPFGYHNYCPITFKKCLTYSGDFYTNEEEFDYKYDIKKTDEFDIVDLCSHPAKNKAIYGDLAEKKGGNYLVVRYRRGDKFKLNKAYKKGNPYTSDTYTFEDAVHVNFKENK